MNRPRDELFARPALPCHKHARRALRRARDLLEELLDRRALAHELPARTARRAQRFGFRVELRGRQSVKEFVA